MVLKRPICGPFFIPLKLICYFTVLIVQLNVHVQLREIIMHAISYTAARKHLAETMDKICDDHEVVIITRKNARAVVVMSLEDYNAIEETAYLLRSPTNAANLRESIQQYESGQHKEQGLIEE